MKHIITVILYVLLDLLILFLIVPSVYKTYLFDRKTIEANVENKMDDQWMKDVSLLLKADVTDMQQARERSEAEARRIELASRTILAKDIPDFKNSEKLGKIQIESAGIDMSLYFGDSNAVLAIGAGMYAGGALPGSTGLKLVAAHNQKGQFGELEKVAAGDTVKLSMPYGDYEYKVTEAKVVKSSDQSAYDFQVKKDQLIVYTCYPMYYTKPTDLRLFLYCDKTLGPVIQ